MSDAEINNFINVSSLTAAADVADVAATTDVAVAAAADVAA